MKRKLALALAILIGLSIFLSSPSNSRATEKQDICLLIFERCVARALLADTSTLSTCNALQLCDNQRLACYILMMIMI
ncbi:MAG: hypothetical protein N3G18_03355 [Candidatus Saccharicenans sp.]|nr:hypothetical protein [Candidatus Saccharicenans sp.]